MPKDQDPTRRQFLAVSGMTVLAQFANMGFPLLAQATEKYAGTGNELPNNETPFRMVFALYPGMTQLDFTGPHQFLSYLPNSQTIIASVAGGEVPADGLKFADTQRLADIASCDLILVPGGLGVTRMAQEEAYLSEIRRLARGAQYVTSVCTGSVILGAAGLLQGKRAACHWGWLDLLPLFGAIPDERRVVIDGNIITGGGVTAGIDFALTVMATVAGEQFAQAMQLNFEYAPAPPYNAGSLATAPADIVAQCRKTLDMVAGQRRAEAVLAAARI